MLLNNLFIAGDTIATPKTISIRGKEIIAVSHQVQTGGIDLNGALAFPGFINSHDHLDFNLFPPLGNRIYSNYREWGTDIHTVNKQSINRILQVPTHIRTRWGMYKNLVNGFTTVVNHGNKLLIDAPFISVYQDACSLHSLSFEKYWKLKLNNPFTYEKQVAIHIGEGTDLAAHEEIGRLVKWNIASKALVGIHGVAMDSMQAKHFSALVWCPASNRFLLGETADIDQLKKHTRILFGSDSTLTAGWNIWQQIAPEIAGEMITPDELFASIGSTPAEAWGMHDRGSITTGKRADIVVTMNQWSGTKDPLINGPDDILLVVQDGVIRLFDESLYNRFAEHYIRTMEFTKIRTGKRCKYVFGNLVKLVEETKVYCSDIAIPLMIES